MNMDWTATEILPSTQRDTMPAAPNKASPAENLAAAPRRTPTARNEVRTRGIAAVDLPQVNQKSVTEPPVGSPQIDMTGEKELDADSPDVQLDELKYWHGRGRAIQGTQMGNSSAGGGGGKRGRNRNTDTSRHDERHRSRHRRGSHDARGRSRVCH